MKTSFLLSLLLVVLCMTSCTPDILLQPDQSWRMFNSLQQGQSIEWDEEIIDSLILPTCLQDSPTVFKNSVMEPQREKWHVTVTVPDSSVKQFRIQREVTIKPVWDTLAAASQRIFKTVAYGTSYVAYTESNSVVNQTTMSGSLEDANFSDLPFFEYRPDSIVTNLYREEFVDSLESHGCVVTDLGSAGIRAVKAITEGGKTYTCTAVFDQDYLTIVSSKIEDAYRTLSEVTYQYSSISNLRIATQIKTLNHTTLGADMLAVYAQKMPERDYTCLGNLKTRSTTILSNIVLP